jgi:hypothetical protein
MQPKSDGPNKSALYKALGVLLWGLAIFFILPSIYEIQQATQAADWTPQNARITYAEVAQYGGGRAHDVPLHAIDIQGKFLDTNETFKVERIAFGQFNDLSQIRMIIAQHPPGSELIVYVAPDDPNRVVLVKDVNIFSMIYLITLGCACAFVGTAIYLRGRKLGEKRRDEDD